MIAVLFEAKAAPAHQKNNLEFICLFGEKVLLL